MKKTIVLLMMGLLVLSCTPHEKPDSDKVIISENAKMIDDQTWNNNIISVDSTDFTLTFKESLSGTQPLKKGDVIVSTIGDGMLRKVKDVVTTKAAGEIVVQTEFASLTDVIEQASISKKITLTTDDIETIVFYSDTGEEVPNNVKGPIIKLLNKSFDMLIYDNDGNTSTTEDQVRVRGSIDCEMEFIFDLVIKSFSVVSAKNGIVTTENVELELLAGLAKTLNKEVPIARIYFTPITIPISATPPFSIIITPQLDLILGVKGYINGSITCGVSQNFNVATGIQYSKNSGWSSYNTPNFNFTFNQPQLNTNAGISTYLKTELSTKIMAIAGPYINGQAYLKLDADLQKTPWWEMYGGFNVNAGMHVKILDIVLLDYHKNGILEYEKLITHAPIKPTVTTGNVTNITETTASCTGNVTSDGRATITARGICWNTSPNPTISHFKTSNGTGLGTYTGNLTNLTPSTTYYVRAYATNAEGTAYGEQKSFKTSKWEGGSSFVDSRDGNLYKTVTIGEQIWMAENLAYLPSVSLPTSGSSSSPYYYVYDYKGTSYTEAKNTDNYKTYGVLYNWFAAMNGAKSSTSNPSGVQGVCPAGWHLPSDAEWTQLLTYLADNGYKYDASIGNTTEGTRLALALVANNGWKSSTSEGAAGNTDYPEYRYKSGFTALPGGYRFSNGTFSSIGSSGYWWSSTESNTLTAWYRSLLYNSSHVGRYIYGKEYGFSVRCVRD